MWCRKHNNWTYVQWGREIFTDESRFSLTIDSGRTHFLRAQGTRNNPSNTTERDRIAGGGVLVWGGIMLGTSTDLHIFQGGSVPGARYCTEVLPPHVRLFRDAMGYVFIYLHGR